jgi:hypothetical protein
MADDAEIVDEVTAAHGERQAEEHREVVQARALLEKAERLLETASAEDKDDLVDLSEAVRDALADNDLARLAPAVAALSDLIYYLET